MSEDGIRKPRHDAARALGRGATIREAARLAGVDPRTVRRWQGEETFRQAVDGFQAGHIGRATGKLAKAAGKAVATLEKLLGNESGATALGAARAILEHCKSYREGGTLEKRLAEIEVRLGIGTPAVKGVAA